MLRPGPSRQASILCGHWVCGRLVGRKHLLDGNHDRVFSGAKRQQEWIELYRDEGGSETIHHGVVDLELADVTGVVLCHFPCHGDSRDQDRFVDQRPPDDGRWLPHGHMHERWRQRGRMINVGVDAWMGGPVAEATIIGLIEAGEHDLDPLPWGTQSA